MTDWIDGSGKERDVGASERHTGSAERPNILILCMDQWDTRMQLPAEVRFPALERLAGAGGQLRSPVLHRPHLYAVTGDDVDGRACQPHRGA